LRERKRQHALDLGGVDRDGGSRVALTKQLLREQAAK